MGTYLVLASLLLPLHPSLSLSSNAVTGEAASLDSMTRVWIALVGAVGPVLVMWSRVRLGVHTPAQTWAGAALGVAKGCIWFTAWNGTDLVLGTESSSSNALSTWILHNGLKDTVGVRVDALIAQAEANSLQAFGSS
ncbi:hypothetical protein [Sporisorium scitamineum]|nr:hypothetical protein [Sporisorium scitamineum]